MSLKKLPEISVSDGQIVQAAKEMSQCRARIATLEEQQSKAESRIKDNADAVRHSEQNKNNYIGLIRVVDESIQPTRVEFRIGKSSALALSEEKKLDGLFGAKRPLLFERDKVITQITDPGALIDELKARGNNPWDYLDIKVKPGLDRALADSKNVIVDEAFLPKKGFLETLNDMVGTLKAEAVTYVREYLDRVLSTHVVMTKAKGDKK